jgi:hypothetical protein
MTTWTREPHAEFLFSPDYCPQLADSLDDILDFNNPPVRVHPDGTLTTETLYAPESFDMGEDDADVIGQARSAGWELVTGYSNQHGYSGPVMHTSEYIGGGMARAVLATPGVYAVATVDDANNDGYPIGWVLMRKVGA